jgi:signal transduction histidine kinase
LPEELETTIYRVAQEALTNVLRHGRSSAAGEGVHRVSIVIHRRPEEVLTVIEDDGRGFDVEAALSLPPGQRRLGIFGMQERARLAGGTLSIESEAGIGTAVYLRLPLTEEGEANVRAADFASG